MPPTTTPAPEARRPEVDPEPPQRSPRQRLALAAGLGAVALMAVMWVYALFIYDPGLQADELADRTFPIAAERVCARAIDRLDRLPPATASRTPEERAAVVEQADAILATMVDDLEPLVPRGQGRVTSGIEEWIDDWRDHIADRAAYARAVRSDPGARFTERTKGTRQLSRAIDGFAQVNRMASCATPDDVG